MVWKGRGKEEEKLGVYIPSRPQIPGNTSIKKRERNCVKAIHTHGEYV